MCKKHLFCFGSLWNISRYYTSFTKFKVSMGFNNHNLSHKTLKHRALTHFLENWELFIYCNKLYTGSLSDNSDIIFYLKSSPQVWNITFLELIKHLRFCNLFLTISGRYPLHWIIISLHYIILKNEILKSSSSIFPWSEGYITQYTP